jgi:hypothetical protein
MDSIYAMYGAEVLARGALAAVFAVSGTMKLRAPGEFGEAVRELGSVPRRWVRPVGAAAVAAELGTAAALAVPATGVYGPCCAIALLAVFTGLIARSLWARRGGGPSVSCACFGAGGAEIGALHLVRNAVLLALAVVGVAASGASAGFDAGYWPPLALVLGLLVGTVVVLLDDLAYLLRRTA